MLRLTTWTPAVAALALTAGVWSVARAQMPRDPRPPFPKPMPQVGVYEGSSMSGSIQEAMDGAVARAMMDQPGTEGNLRYRVVEIFGSAAGGNNTVHVSIQLEGIGRQPSVTAEHQR